MWLLSVYEDSMYVLSCRFDVQCIVYKYQTWRRYEGWRVTTWLMMSLWMCVLPFRFDMECIVYKYQVERRYGEWLVATWSMMSLCDH